MAENKTILIAEDHEYNFILLQELLRNQELEILHARNGKEAVKMLSKTPSITLILMDIKMPEMDGHTAALEIKKTHPELPIIAQSAFALEHEKRRFEGAAFNDYITKPIDKDKLMKTLSKYIDLKL